MTVLLVILAVLLLILYTPIILRIEIEEDTKLTLYLFFIPIKINLDKEEKEEKPKKKKKIKKEVEEDLDIKIEKKETLSQKIQEVLGYVKLGGKIIGRDFKPIIKFLGGITVYKLRLVIIIKGDDSAEVAMKYGKVVALVNGAYVVINNFIKVEKEEILIIPEFVGTDNQTQASFRVRTTAVAMLYVAGIVLVRAVKYGLQGKKKGLKMSDDSVSNDNVSDDTLSNDINIKKTEEV